MTAAVVPWDSKAPGWFVVSGASARERGPGPCILSPVLAGLGSALSDIAAVLPVGDANALLLSELAQAPASPSHVVAALFGSDPFRQQENLLLDLEERGVGAVANWPSLGPISGELSQALTHSGFTFEMEIELLRRSSMMGLATVAFVCGPEQAERAIAEAFNMIVIVPPLAATTQADQRAAGQEAETLFGALAARSDTPELRLYLPERLVGCLDIAGLEEGQLIRLAPDATPQAKS